MIDERGLLAAVRSAWRGSGYEVVGNGQELVLRGQGWLAVLPRGIAPRKVLALLVDLHEPGQWRPDLLDYAMLHATDAAVDYSTRAYLIKLMAVMCRPYPDLAREVETFLDVLPPDVPPSLRVARRQALLLLRQRSRRNGRSG